MVVKDDQLPKTCLLYTSATGIFVARWIYLGENNAEGDASVGADISDVHVELQNSPE